MEKFFKFKAHATNVKTESIAGLTTFLTAAYIIFVNPDILSATGMDKGALITTTCVVSGLATILMGLWANAPLMMAPGMGVNAFFAFGLCLGMGIPWQTALGVVFISGVLFLILTAVGIREKIVDAIPASLRLSTSVGIGLFITFIGLRNLGLIVNNDAVLVGLGKIDTPVLCGLIGLIIMSVLEVMKVRGAILIGIFATTIIGFVFGLVHAPGAVVSTPASMAPIAMKLDVAGALTTALAVPIFTFMFVDLFDSLGTMLAVAHEADMVEKDGRVRNIGKMLGADAVATVFGAFLGTSTTTTYIESASGVAAGGRTGFTSIVTGILFLLAAFFGPIIGMVPAFATAPALVIVGLHMTRGIHRIDFNNVDEGIPAFLTIILMPLTYSIANGLVFGFLSYVLLKLLLGKMKDLNPVLVVVAILCLVNLVLGA
ncbi:MAG: guanine permease [Deltaproteobacteria bacterium]|mgnify:CR=1 FL=1|nr:MAG: guanine permease [Deltaproteobacteria bacterium]